MCNEVWVVMGIGVVGSDGWLLAAAGSAEGHSGCWTPSLPGDLLMLCCRLTIAGDTFAGCRLQV